MMLRSLIQVSALRARWLLVFALVACGTKPKGGSPTVASVMGVPQGQTLDALSIGISPSEGGPVTQFAYVVDTRSLGKVKTVKKASIAFEATAASGSNFAVKACIGLLNPTPTTTGRELGRWPCVDVPFEAGTVGTKRIDITPYLPSFVNDRFTLFLIGGEKRQGYNLSRVAGLVTFGEPVNAGFQFDAASIKLEVDSVNCESGCVGEAQGCGEFADQASCTAHAEGSGSDMGCNFVTGGVCVGKFSGSCIGRERTECPPQTGLLAGKCEFVPGTCVANCGASDPASCGDGPPTRCEEISDRGLCGGPCEWRTASCDNKPGSEQCGTLRGEECTTAVREDRCLADNAGRCRPREGACQEAFEAAAGGKARLAATATRQQQNNAELCIRDNSAQCDGNEVCEQKVTLQCTCKNAAAYCENDAECVSRVNKVCQCLEPAYANCSTIECINQAREKCRGELSCDSTFCSYSTSCQASGRDCRDLSSAAQPLPTNTARTVGRQTQTSYTPSGSGEAARRYRCVETKCGADAGKLYGAHLRECLTSTQGDEQAALACAARLQVAACSNRCANVEGLEKVHCVDDCYACVDQCQTQCGQAGCEPLCSGEIDINFPQREETTTCAELEPMFCAAQVQAGNCTYVNPNQPPAFSCESLRFLSFPTHPDNDALGAAVSEKCQELCGGNAVKKKLHGDLEWWVCQGTPIEAATRKLCAANPEWCGRPCQAVPGREVPCQSAGSGTYIAKTPPSIVLDDSCFSKLNFDCGKFNSPTMCSLYSPYCSLACNGQGQACTDEVCARGSNPNCRLAGKCDDQASRCTNDNCDPRFCIPPDVSCRPPSCPLKTRTGEINPNTCNSALCNYEAEGCYPRQGAGCSAGSANIDQCLEAGCNFGLPYCQYSGRNRRPTCGAATTQAACDENAIYGCSWASSGCAQRAEFACSDVPLAQCDSNRYPGCRPADQNCPGNQPPTLNDPKCSKSSTDDSQFFCGATYKDPNNHAPQAGSTTIRFFVGDTPQCGPFETTALATKTLDFTGQGVDLAYSIQVPSEEVTECSKGVSVATIREGKFRYCINAKDVYGAAAPEVCASVPYEMFAGYGLVPPGCKSSDSSMWAALLVVISAGWAKARRARKGR